MLVMIMVGDNDFVVVKRYCVPLGFPEAVSLVFKELLKISFSFDIER